MSTVIEIDNVSKRYRLGVIGSRRLVDDVNRKWASLRVRPDPRAKITHGTDGKPQMATGDELWALRDVSFSVKDGEVLGIIGRNGAGKSTMLKILSRVTAPTKGEIRVRGRIASLLEVGTGFHPELTGRENIYLNGAILGMTRSEIAKKFDEIVEFAEVAKFVDTPVKRYSSGMFVRLAFAVAAHLEPEILIVDEVLAVGDVAFQEKCLGKMKSVAGEGRTVLFVSHNMATIQQLCKRCILFRHGKIDRSGDPTEIISEYLSDSHNEGHADIRDWGDRSGNGDARIVQFDIRDAEGNSASVTNRGDSVQFDLGVEVNRPLIDPVLGVVIHSSLGEPIIDLRSVHDDLRIGRTPNTFSVSATLDNIGLYPGRYFLSPWISANGREVDFPRMCASFQVNPKPGSHIDLALDPKWGKYYFPSEWRMN